MVAASKSRPPGGDSGRFPHSPPPPFSCVAFRHSGGERPRSSAAAAQLPRRFKKPYKSAKTNNKPAPPMTALILGVLGAPTPEACELVHPHLLPPCPSADANIRGLRGTPPPCEAAARAGAPPSADAGGSTASWSSSNAPPSPSFFLPGARQRMDGLHAERWGSPGGTRPSTRCGGRRGAQGGCGSRAMCADSQDRQCWLL